MKKAPNNYSLYIKIAEIIYNKTNAHWQQSLEAGRTIMELIEEDRDG